MVSFNLQISSKIAFFLSRNPASASVSGGDFGSCDWKHLLIAINFKHFFHVIHAATENILDAPRNCWYVAVKVDTGACEKHAFSPSKVSIPDPMTIGYGFYDN